MIGKILTIFLLCSLSLSSVGQQFIVKSFDNTNGLISASNSCTYQDSSNYYWISSYGGLVRFDGSSFKAFRNADGIHDYLVNSIFERRKNDFIVCNQFSLLHFDGTRFQSIQTNISKQYQFENIVRLSDGTQLIQTNLGVFKFQHDSVLTSYTLSSTEKIGRLIEYAPNKLLVYFNQAHRIGLYENGRFIEEEILANDIKISSLSNLGSLPILLTNKGVLTLGKLGWVPLKLNTIKESSLIKSVFQDSKKRIWFTDSQDNLWLSNGGSIQNLSKRYSTKSVIEPSYMEDHDGNIVVTSVYGILIFRESGIDEIQIDEVNNTDKNYTLNLFSSDTVLVALSSKGFIAFSKGRKILIPISASFNPCKKGIERCDLFATDMPSEFLVRLTNLGLFYLKNNQLKPFCKVPFDLSRLYKGYYDISQKCYYAGDINKLFRIKENSIDSFDVSAISRGLTVNSIHKIPNGMVLFSLGHEHLLSYFKGKIIDMTSQLKTQGKTFSIDQFGNSLWVIVHGVELQEYQVITNQLKWKRSIGKTEGLVDANIAKMVFDDENEIWLNTFSGIYVLKLENDSPQISSKKISLHLDNSNAPMINDILFYNKHLYALGIGSIIDIDKVKVQDEIKPYSTYFSSIEVNSTDINTLVKTHLIELNENLYILPTKYNSFLFQCNSVYFGFDDGIQYQYKLEGNDDEWKSLNLSNSIQYTNLSSGRYKLLVRSVNKLSHNTYASAQFEFIIQPPFWQTWWFRSVLAILAISSIYLFIKRRDQIKEKENKLKMQMSELKLMALQSQMNPHFLFNSLNSIQNYIMQQKPIDAARYLSKFSKLMRRILDQSFNHESSLEEIIETINMYLELEAFRFNNEFEWNVITNDKIEKAAITLPPMIIQPFVENAIIHGLMPKQGAKKLTIEFYSDEGVLNCVIDDNGVGRNMTSMTEKTHISRGQKLTTDMISTMKEIFNKDVTIEYVDKIDNNQNSLGTTVRIIIPQ